MAKKDGLDYIYVVWQDPKSRSKFVIGTLSRNGHYEFAYGGELEQAKKCGFMPLVAFPLFEKKYEENVVFPTFSCRLPDVKRKDIGRILAEYGLTEYDEFELLKKSGARLPTDTLEFVDPIFDDQEVVDRTFHVAGMRYHMECAGEDCNAIPQLPTGTELTLQREPENQHDPHAVRIVTGDGVMLGYVPRYYSEAVSKRLEKGMSYTCQVVEHNRKKMCGECLKIRLQMPAISM